jgi:hypothetical protein
LDLFDVCLHAFDAALVEDGDRMVIRRLMGVGVAAMLLAVRRQPIDGPRRISTPGQDDEAVRHGGEHGSGRGRHHDRQRPPVLVVKGDTFLDLARFYGLGYNELEQANPGVDPGSRRSSRRR